MKRRLIFEYVDDNRVVVEDPGSPEVDVWAEDRCDGVWRRSSRAVMLSDAELETILAWRAAVRRAEKRNEGVD